MTIGTPSLGEIFDGITFVDDIFVSVPDVTFRNCVFDGCGLRVNGGPSSPVASGITIEACKFIESPHHAIFLNWYAPDAQIVNNQIIRPAKNGIWIGNGSDDAIIQGNRVVGAGRMGIEVWHAAGCSIAGNRIKNTANGGISCDHNDGGTVVGNILTDINGWGIENAGSIPLAVTGNTVLRAAQRPLSASIPGQVTIAVGNTFIDCGWGLQIFEGGPGTIIVGNYFNNVGSGEGANGRTIFVNNSPDTLVEDNTLIAGEAHTAIFGAAGHNHRIGYPWLT